MIASVACSTSTAEPGDEMTQPRLTEQARGLRPDVLETVSDASGKQGVDAYIAAAPKAAQPRLRQLRKLIKDAAPAAAERLSYGMPYYDYRGRLIYFSAFKNHIGVYPVGEAEKYNALARYMTGKGTYRFPLDEPMPMDLIRKLGVCEVVRCW